MDSIIDSNTSASSNPFRNASNADTNIDGSCFDNPGEFPSPQRSSPGSYASDSAHPPPNHPPPNYSHRETEHFPTASDSVKTAGMAPEQPQLTQLQSSSPSVYSSPSFNSEPGNYPSSSSHSHGTYAISMEPSMPFSRRAPQQEYPSFEPTFLIASGKFLTHGFPALPPPSQVTPHPFASHDVSETDWTRFLEEVKEAGRLTEQQEHRARLPIVSILPVVGSISTGVIRQQMKKGKTKGVVAVIDRWNHHFFNPRHIEASLVYGITQLGGSGTRDSSGGLTDQSGIQKTFTSYVGREKGMEREEDNIYRLFIMPLPIHKNTT